MPSPPTASLFHTHTWYSYLTMPGATFSSNITIYFLPGTHSLQSEHVIGNISELHLLSYPFFPSETAKVSCEPTAKLLLENIHRVRVRELIRVSSQFLYALVGGALIVDSSNVSATGSRFEGNIAEIGGAIFSEGDSNVTLTNYISINNQALSSSNLNGAGGVLSASELTHVTIAESDFYNNSARRDGGVVFMTRFCNLIICQCQFSNNKAFDGGVVSANYQSNITILDSDFNNNTAYDSGGAIRIHEGSMLYITNSSFRDCTANVGGVMTQRQTHWQS